LPHTKDDYIAPILSHRPEPQKQEDLRMIMDLQEVNALMSSVQRIILDQKDLSKDDQRMIISRLEGSALMLNVQKITYVLKDLSRRTFRRTAKG